MNPHTPKTAETILNEQLSKVMAYVKTFEQSNIPPVYKPIILAAMEEYASLSYKGGVWVSVEKEMPKENDFVLLFNGSWRGVGRYSPDKEHSGGEDDEKDPEWVDETTEFIFPIPTYWMPLPKPPSDESVDNKAAEGLNQPKEDYWKQRCNSVESFAYMLMMTMPGELDEAQKSVYELWQSLILKQQTS